jgi:N-acetyltransferase 10
MASTIHGYEGTGRSLSIKLINQLRQQSNISSNDSTSSRFLKEVKLDQAIRYADNDQIESWLNRLLILDSTNAELLNDGYPKLEDLELYYVNRDTLFSFHKGSEIFLKKLMSLFVSSHYKNSPNDLQLLSDAPAHSIFVLCRNIEKDKDAGSKSIPDIYAAVQVCEEGGISKNVILNNNKRGFKPAGDLIPWTISEHYQDNEFPNLTGVRIVRIATHPDCHRMGYGSRALELITQFYEGKCINLNSDNLTNMKNSKNSKNDSENNSKAILSTEEIKPRKKLSPLLVKLTDIKPTFVYYMGTAFGLTKELFSFWKKNEFYPLYLKLTENDITGEHSCIMIRPFDVKENTFRFNPNSDIFPAEYGNKIKWLNPFLADFKKRLITLLGYEFRNFPLRLSLSLIDPQINSTTNDVKDDDLEEIKEAESNGVSDKKIKSLNKSVLDVFISQYDYKRLEMYTKNLVRYQMIIDLVPIIAKFFFLRKFTNLRLSYIQAAILLGFGLQFKSFDTIAEELNIQTSQLLAMFNKMIKKFTNAIKAIYEFEIEKEDTANKNKTPLHVFLKFYFISTI